MQFGSLKQHLGGRRFTVMRKWKWLFVNACESKGSISTPTEFFKSHAKTGQMLHCARGLCWKVMILQWNKKATFKVAVTSHLIFMT
jgi:hypothetical protein